MSEILGQVWPQVFKSGDEITIRVENLPDGLGEIAAALHAVDSVESYSWMQVPLEKGEPGTAYAKVTARDQDRESAVYLSEIVTNDDRLELPQVSFSICNPDKPLNRSDDEVVARTKEIREAQLTRYDSHLGDPSAAGILQYRVAYVIERFLLTQPVQVPGVRAFNLLTRPEGSDLAKLATEAIKQLGWTSTFANEVWAPRFAQDHPAAVIVCERIYAASVEAAVAIADIARDELLSALALMRGASGTAAVTIVERRENDATVETKFRFDHETYRGNLAGGSAAGESQHQLLMHHAALQSDNVLKLCVDLFDEALAEVSPDSRYFRFWSVLETLATNRVTGTHPVVRLDGTRWPGRRNTTEYAAPKVYQLISDVVFGTNAQYESTLVSPAADLYDALTKWYARRNATAHYGKFVIGDGAQMNQGWYNRALATVTSGPGDAWLAAFERMVGSVLRIELNRIGKPLVS